LCGFGGGEASRAGGEEAILEFFGSFFSFLVLLRV
jgi:hypothetical protein